MMLQAPESQKLWVRETLPGAQELAQTVVLGRAVQEPLAPQAWQVGQAETSQQNPLVQLPVEHWLPLVQAPVVCWATQDPPLQ
jgi:hypothetical protein